MVVTAKMRQLASARAAARPGMRPSATRSVRHTSTLSSKEITGRQLTLLIVQGTMVGCAILAIVALVYVFFGSSIEKRFEPRASSVAAGPGTGSSPVGGATILYRDRGDGTVLVMEIDGNGTRIKGTLDRKDVPMIREKRERRRLLEQESISSGSRIHALGSAFR